MRGRKPLPTALKLLRSGRRINYDEPKPDVMVTTEPPVTLEGEALQEWNRRAPALQRLGLLTELDDAALVACCQSWGRYVEAEEKLREWGEVVNTPSGYPIQNPYRAIANKALQQCQSLWSEFGMTPSSRSRVKTSKVVAPLGESKLDKYRQRPK